MNKRHYLFLFIVFLFVLLLLSDNIKEEFKPQSNDSKILEIKQKLKHIYPEVDKLEFYEGSKSYTINKSKVHLCVKDESGNYYNDNMLTYVAIHEIAHVLCNEVGHTAKFYEIFRKLLDKAIDLGIYDPTIPAIQNYCKYSPDEDSED